MARESIAAHWAPYADAGGAPGFVRQIRSLRTADTLAVADRLGTLRVPARVVWGGADRFQKVRFGERLSQDLGAPLNRLEGARHFVPEGHPDAVAEAVVAVLGGPRASDRPGLRCFRGPAGEHRDSPLL